MLPAAASHVANMPWGREWHRFLYSYFYWYGVRQAVNDRDVWLRLIRPPVILMYHAVGEHGEQPGRYLIPARRFARQMAWLRRRRYPVLPLEVLARYRAENRLPPARSMVLTFDDGYADNLTMAYPVLRQHEFPATIFLVSQAVGGVNGWDTAGELAGRPLLSWPDIEALQEGGITVGAHTRHHPALTEIPDDQLEGEVAGSRADLTRQLGRSVELFAYPHGRHDARVQTAVAGAGYLCACCSYAGLNDPSVPQFALRRSEIRGTDSLLGFALLPWLGRARWRPRDSNARRR
jgi:peptidoglycan/xylan/chitin deacetylase (PgdA/CDA1 family)